MDIGTLGPWLAAAGAVLTIAWKLHSFRVDHDKTIGDARAREKGQELRIASLEKWRDSRSERDQRFYERFDEIVQRLASIEAKLEARK